MRSIIILGFSGGLGQSLYDHLSHEYYIYGISRSPIYGPLTPNSCFIHADLIDPDSLESILKPIFDSNEIYALINCIGVFDTIDSLDDISSSRILDSFNINALSATLASSLALRSFRQRGVGRIINTSSGAPFNPNAKNIIYAMSKAALNSVTLSLASSVDETLENIRINLYSPGPINSKMTPYITNDPISSLPTIKFLLSDSTYIPNGMFFWLDYIVNSLPDHSGVDWLNLIPSVNFRRLSL